MTAACIRSFEIGKLLVASQQMAILHIEKTRANFLWLWRYKGRQTVLLPPRHRGEVLAIVGVAVGVGERFAGGVAAATALLRLAINCDFFFRAARR